MEVLDLQDPKSVSQFTDKLLENMGIAPGPGKATIILIDPCHMTCTDMYTAMLGAKTISNGKMPREDVPDCIKSIKEGCCDNNCHEITLEWQKCHGSDDYFMRIWSIREI